MTCAEQFRVMAFAQLTWRESLRDIEVTLGANASKLYAMGLRHSIHRSTLADANEAHDWRIWADVAALLIRRARKLYSDTDIVGLDLKNTVYALDATTIDLCLSLFDWAPFRKAKGVVKLHTLLNLRGAIPAFIHISDGKMHEVNVLDFMPTEAGSFYVMDRGYLDFTRLYALHQAGGFIVTRAKANMNARRIYSAPVDRSTGVICDQTILLRSNDIAQRVLRHATLPRELEAHSIQRCREWQDAHLPDQQLCLAAADHRSTLKNRWQVELFFKWIKQHLRIKKFLGNSLNAVKTQIWCAVSTYVLIAIVKKELQINASLYTLLQILSVSVFDKIELSSAFQGDALTNDLFDSANKLNLF
jgi:hypothetical protein